MQMARQGSTGRAVTDTEATSHKPARRRAGRAAATANAPERARPRRRLFLRWLVLYPAVLVFMVALVPMTLTAVYRIDGIRPVSTLMLGRMLTGEPVDRRWADLDDIAPRLRQSVLMSEDGQFCNHHGVDWDAVELVVREALAGDPLRGASTITMQAAKNLFLWNDRSYIRKGLEIPLALWIDLVLPKRRIMEIYLNIAEWGPDGQFGARAAANAHFGRAPGDLTPRQAALLAVTLPNPHLRDPAAPNAGLNRLAGVIEARAARSGAYIGCLGE